MLKLLVSIFLFFSVATSAKDLSWTDIESRILGSNLEIQAQSHISKAAENDLKATSGVYLPSISLNAGTGRDTTLRDDDRGTQAFVEGKWNLYRGGHDSALRAKSKAAAELEKLNYDIRKREVLFRARELYISIVAIQKSSDILNRESELNKQQRGMAQKKVSAGLTSNVDGIEFDLRSDFIEAEQNKFASEKLVHIAELKALVDSGDDPVVIIGEIAVPQNRELKPINISNSPVRSAAEFEMQISQADKNIARSGFLPEVNVTAAYGRQTLQRDDPIKNDETTAILSVSLPIFSGLSTLNAVRAQNERTFAKEKLIQQTNNVLNAQAEITTSRWKETWSLYELNQKTLERAKKYYELTLGEYRRGVKNSPDLVSATERLFETEMKSISLVKDLNLIQAGIQKTY